MNLQARIEADWSQYRLFYADFQIIAVLFRKMKGYQTHFRTLDDHHHFLCTSAQIVSLKSTIQNTPAATVCFSFYSRLIDGGICLWHGSNKDFQLFSQTFENVVPNIKFITSQLSKLTWTTFLDCSIKVQQFDRI